MNVISQNTYCTVLTTVLTMMGGDKMPTRKDEVSDGDTVTQH